MKNSIVANRDIRSIIRIALALMVFAASMCSAEKIGYYPGSAADLYYPFEITDADHFVFLDKFDTGGYFDDVNSVKEWFIDWNKDKMALNDLTVSQLPDGAGYTKKYEIKFTYKSKARKVTMYQADANVFFPPELNNGFDYYFLKAPTGYNPDTGLLSKIYQKIRVGGSKINYVDTRFGLERGLEPYKFLSSEELVGFGEGEIKNSMLGTETEYYSDAKKIEDLPEASIKQILDEINTKAMKLESHRMAAYTSEVDSSVDNFRQTLEELKISLKNLPEDRQKKIVEIIKNRVIDDIGPGDIKRLETQVDKERLIRETNKLFDDFLRDLGLLARAAVKAIRITETTVEVLQADGTTKTYNSHAEFMAAPAADRTIGGQRIDLIENEMQVAGEAVHIGPNRYYEGVPAPGETRLVQDPTVIEEVVVTELPDGTAHYDLHVTHTDADGSIYRSRVRTDASGTVIESEILDGTRLSKIGRLKSVMGGLRNSRVVRLGTTGAEYVGVFGHGLILAIAVNGIYYGEWKWVAPELATVTVTGIFLKAGATALRANLIGTIVGSIFELGIYAWEERDANVIKAEFGIEQTSAWDTVKGGLGRMAESYRNLLKLFTTPDNEYGMALEDKIVGDMDTYLAENYEAKGITPGQIQQLKEQLMRNGQYSQKYHEQLIVPLESGLFDIEDLNGDYLKGGYSPTSNPEELAKVLNIRMCGLLEELQKDKELPKVGVYIDEKSFREVMDKELFWWKTQLIGAQNGLQASKKQKTVPDPNSCGIGINRILESTSGDTIIEDDVWGGDSFDTYYINADKGKGFIDVVRKSLEGMNCEDISEDLQYRVFVKNNFEEDVKCDKAVNTVMNTGPLKWEIKTGTECDKADGYTDITTSICKETAPLKVERGSDVEAFCTSDQIKAKYPKKSGPYCVRVTWCGQSEVFKYGGKEEEKLKIMSDQGSSKGAGGGTPDLGGPTSEKCYKLYGEKVKKPLSFTLNPTNRYVLSDDYIRQKLNAAMETWQKETTFDLFGDAVIDKSLHAGYGSTNPYAGKNVISFEDSTSMPQLNDDPAQGLTNSVGGEIIGCDIALNTKYLFGEPNGGTQIFDLQGILTHEIGHCLGLADVQEEKCSYANMYNPSKEFGYQKAYDDRLRGLSQADKDGLKAIYG
jgi:hypothetical protein